MILPSLVHGALDNPAQRLGGRLKSLYGLCWRHRCSIKLLGNLPRLGGLKPHHPDIVHVSHNRGDGSAFAIRRFSCPCLGRKIFDQVTIDPIIDVERIYHCGWQTARKWGGFIRSLFAEFGHVNVGLAGALIWHKLGALARGSYPPTFDADSGAGTTSKLRRMTQMKVLAQLLCVALFAGTALSQDHSAHMQPHSVALVTGLGDLHHPVTTHNPEAQKFFDQGLRYIYAFNHDEAARSFQHAGDLDPKLAMAFWGVAEAVGPNYNDPADPERFKRAHEAAQKAVDLSEGASPSEQAYIKAMAKRFPADPKADLQKAAEEYRDAMRQVNTDFPDDLDAATLFAESGMNLHPWGLWHQDGTPQAGTDEIVATLESVIKRDPNHLGAIHYYIHAVEASNNPAASARRRQQTRDSSARRRPHCPHAGSYLYPDR